MLEREFENCAGEEEVLRGDYRLLDARFYNRALTWYNWEQGVFPGTEVVMSVLMTAARTETGRCARSGCGGARELKSTFKEVWSVIFL